MPASQIQQSADFSPSDPDIELVLAASAEPASRALRADARAPLFTLADAAGRYVALEELLHAGPVVLRFFGGAWCSFGEGSVTEFASRSQDVIALGASAVAIALPSQKVAQNIPLAACELSDVDIKVACAYGLAFELPVNVRPKYQQLGYTPPLTRKSRDWIVPLPATSLLDRDVVVVLAFIHVDYRNHCGCGALLTGLKGLRTRHAMRRKRLHEGIGNEGLRRVSKTPR
jgi:peroxiredoxin